MRSIIGRGGLYGARCEELSTKINPPDQHTVSVAIIAIRLSILNIV